MSDDGKVVHLQSASVMTWTRAVMRCDEVKGEHRRKVGDLSIRTHPPTHSPLFYMSFLLDDQVLRCEEEVGQ